MLIVQISDKIVMQTNNQPQQAEAGDQTNLLTLSEKKPRNKSGLLKEFTSPTRQQQSFMIDLSTMLSSKKEANSFKSPANLTRNKTQIITQNSTQKQDSLSTRTGFVTQGQSTNVKVVIRVRPLNDREKALGAQSKTCIQVEDCSKIMLDRGHDLKNFTFDYVAGYESTQEEIFLKIAQPITDSCLQGYNGTIFAYGQTGSGKTFTIQGPSFTSPQGEEQLISATNTTGVQLEARGLMQRSFEHIFACIDREQQEAELNTTEIKYLIKSSYLEIYNEQVMDLLDPQATNLHVREDIKTGVYVEGLIEEPISCVKDIMTLISRGSRNRHVGSTAMNKESSRSHSVLTTQIESKTMTAAGVWQMKSSCFHIIDLAGSERSKHTHAEGQRLKEAGMINKSLSALGIVINSLVDISEGKTRHVHYRDSKLTFLLRDSLGGNSKTVIIANITQALVSASETMSTLQFAQRAKLIKNKAVINEESSGTIQILKAEIRRLKFEMAEMERVQHEKPTVLPVIEFDSTVCSLCRAEVCQSNSSFTDEMLVESPSQKPKTPEATKARIAQLENLLSANLDNLTSSHKYFEVEAEKKNLSFKRMQQAMEQLDKQSQRDKMIIKFRDQRIIKLEQTIADSAVGCQQCESIKGQVVELAKERDEWREMYDKQTSTLAAKLFAEKEELRRQNEILTLEIKQTPESLNAQLRGFNELTDSLSQYLKEHFDRSEFELFSQQKLDLEVQLEQLQSKLTQTINDHSSQIQELETKHQTAVKLMEHKLQEVHDKSRVEQQSIQQEANQQIAQIKSDLMKLSTESESTIVDKFEGICREQDLQQKLSQLNEDSEHTQDQLNKQINQLQESLQKQSLLSKQQDELHTEKFNSLQQDRESFQVKIKAVSLEYDKDIQSLQKSLFIAEANSDSLKESQSELEESRVKLEIQNEDLLKSQLVIAEEHSQVIQNHSQELQQLQKQNDHLLKLIAEDQNQQIQNHCQELQQLQKDHQLKIDQLTLQFREQIDSILKEKVQSESKSTLDLSELESNNQEKQSQLENKYALNLQQLQNDQSEKLSELQSKFFDNLEIKDKCHQDQFDLLKLEHLGVLESLSKNHDVQVLQTTESHSSFLDQAQKINSFKIEELQKHHCETLELLKQEIQTLNNSQSDSFADLTKKNETLSQEFVRTKSELESTQSKLIDLEGQHLKDLGESEQLLQESQVENASVKQSLKSVQSELSNLESQKLVQEDQNITARSQLTAHHLKELQDLQVKHQTTTQQLLQQLDSLKSQSQESILKYTNFKSDTEIKSQKLLNSLKQAELDIMSMQSQNLLLRQEYDRCQVNYSIKLESIEATIRATLDVEKQATKQELEAQYSEQLVIQEQLLTSQHRADLQNQLKQVEQKLSKEFQNRSQKLGRNILNKLKVLKTEQIQLKVDASNNLKINSDDLSKQFIDAHKQNQDLVQQKHQAALKGQLKLVAELRQESQDNQECLKEYKGLCNQLQLEKQAMTKASNQLYVQLKEAETELLKYYEQHEDSAGLLQANRQRLSQERQMVEESMKVEMEILRGQLVDVSTNLTKHKARCQDLQLSLKQSKDTISGLVEKENALMDELQGKMGELGINQDKWKQKVQEQKVQLADQKKVNDQLQSKYEVLCLSISQNTHNIKMEDELTLLRQTVQKREAEIKEIVRTLKKFSDDKKLLEQENAHLVRKSDTSEGHQNLQQKIQHHLKIKDENNKLREENYQLQQEARRKSESLVLVPQQHHKDCLQMVECFDDLVDKLLTAPGSVQLLKQMPQLNDTLRRAQQSTSTSSQAAVNCKQKALVLSEIIANMSRRLKMTVGQDPYGPPATQPQQPQPHFKQPTQQRATSGTLHPSASLNLRAPLPEKQQSQQQPQQFSGTQQKPPNGLSSSATQLDKDNKMTSATAFLNSITQRSNSGFM